MKQKSTIIVVIICLFMAVCVIFYFAIKIHKSASRAEENSVANSNAYADRFTNSNNHGESNSDYSINESTKKEGSTPVKNTQKDDVTKMLENAWEKLYHEFIKNEKENPSFTLTEFDYAFVSMKEFEHPFLLIRDKWNMYLYYELNGRILPATENNGDKLSLSRMNNAYLKNGELYLEGACGAPEAFYLCKVLFDDGFSLKYVAEGYNTSDGQIVYHDDEGNEVSKETYENERTKAIGNAKEVSFSSAQ